MKNIKKIRQEKRLTQIAVQMKTGIDQAHLSKIERGERLPSTENLLSLAALYETSMDYLMDRTDKREPYPPKKDAFSKEPLN